AAGAPEPGLNLVGDQQGSVTAADIESPLQISVIRQIDAFALDRLDDECCDLAGGEGPVQRLQILGRNFETLRDKRTESVAKQLVAVERQCAQCQTVKCVTAVCDCAAPGGCAGKFQRSLDGFGSRIGEKDPIEIGHVAQQPFGQYAGQR